jgi:hypothetical protein
MTSASGRINLKRQKRLDGAYFIFRRAARAFPTASSKGKLHCIRALEGIVALALAALLTGPLGQAHAQGDRSPTFVAHRESPNKKRTTVVTMGMYLVDFARINAREETFDLEGFLAVTWHDPELSAEMRASGAGTRTLAADQFRLPSVEFINSIDAVKIKNEGSVHVEPDGRAQRLLRFSGKFSTPLHLQNFPFDSQTLRIYLTAYNLQDDRFVLKPDVERTGRSKEAFLTEWDIGTTTYEVETRHDDIRGKDISILRFDIPVYRKSHSYHWRALLPMTLLVIASWSVFWFEPTNLQPQISTALAILLSFVTFTFSIDYSMPRMAYLTFLDRYDLTSFVFVQTAILMVAVIHVTLNRRGIEAALVIQWWARRLYPAVYALAILVVIATSLVRWN